jgi:putative endonuclease
MWFVYILECADGTLYTGITTSLARRLKEHNETSKAAKYTRSRRPVELVAFCIVKDRSAALKLESKVKSLKKSEKIAYLTKEKSNDLEENK